MQNIQLATKLAKEMNLPIIATNDAHYAKKEHYKAHEEFRECEQVERTLGRMIQAAIDHQYLKEFIK